MPSLAELPRFTALHLIFRAISPGHSRAEHNGRAYEIHRIDEPSNGVAIEFVAEVKTRNSGRVLRIDKFRTARGARTWLNDQATAAQGDHAQPSGGR